jgi:HAD superfamily hydrolase (TIGR01490 family)
VTSAAFFDLDKTIIAKSAVLAFGPTLYREGLLSRRTIVRGMYSQIVFMLVGADEDRMDRLRESMLSLIKGWNRDRVASIVEEALDEIITPIVYLEALDLFAEHREAGRPVVIVSSSPEEVVGPLTRHLGADDFIATRSALDDDGCYTGELDFYAYGPHKADAIREYATAHGIGLESSFAYSDSITDVPMLEVVGHPVTVNADRELARYATDHDWEQMHFTRPVRMRDRVPVPSGRSAIAVGAVAAAGTGVALWWWLRHRNRALA